MEHSNGPITEENLNGHRRRSKRNRIIFAVVLSVSAHFGLRIWNYFSVGYPVASKLEADPRNKAFSISAHYSYYVNTGTLILDLTRSDNASPADLFRGIFQCAEALSSSDRVFEWVVLARSGRPAFLLTGKDFSQIGREFSAGQNPVYLIRTLPERLLNVKGDRAYSEWQGGLLGVFGKQMSDANDAARKWALGP